MEFLSSLDVGFDAALTFSNLGIAQLGAFLGTMMGALPGLGPANGVTILIPIAFLIGLGPLSSLILMTSVYYGAMCLPQVKRHTVPFVRLLSGGGS